MIARRAMLVATALLLAGQAGAQQVAPVAAPASATPPAVWPVPVAPAAVWPAPVAPAAASPAPVARPAARPRPRRPATQPNQPAAPPAPVTRGDPAPVPNHDLEAPQRSAARATPQLNPALIDPVQPQVGTARDAASLQSREDRLLRQPAAGARLRLPFGY